MSKRRRIGRVGQPESRYVDDEAAHSGDEHADDVELFDSERDSDREFIDNRSDPESEENSDEDSGPGIEHLQRLANPNILPREYRDLDHYCEDLSDCETRECRQHVADFNNAHPGAAAPGSPLLPPIPRHLEDSGRPDHSPIAPLSPLAHPAPPAPFVPLAGQGHPDLVVECDQLCQKILYNGTATNDLIHELFELDLKRPDVRYNNDFISVHAYDHLIYCSRLQRLLHEAHLLDKPRMLSLTRVRNAIFQLWRAAAYIVKKHDLNDPNTALEVVAGDDDEILRFFEPLDAKYNDAQLVQEFLLTRAHELHLRRADDGETLYIPMTRDNGQPMVSFRTNGTNIKNSSISKFLYREINRDVNPAMYAKLTRRSGTAAGVINYLSNCKESALPEYVPEHHIHGFGNGFYHTMHDRAYFYDDSPPEVYRHVAKQHHNADLQREWFERVRPLTGDGPNGRIYQFRYGAGLSRCYNWPIEKRHGRDVPPPPLHIRTDTWERIMDGQEWSDRKKLWWYAMVGRLMYRVGEMDQFGVLLLLSGATEAGKSTMLDAIVASLFPARNHIGIMSDNKETTFGLQDLYDKDAIFTDEMGKKPNWNKNELKSMATGGWMSIARKHRGAEMLRWLGHIMISSNWKSPEWRDESGAIARRFAPFHCPNSITEQDGTIPVKLMGESAAFLVKCNMCYHYVLDVYGSAGFASIAPEEVIGAQRDMRKNMSPIAQFLNDTDCVEVAPTCLPNSNDPNPDHDEVYCPTSILQQVFEQWKKNNGIRLATRWCPDLYEATFKAAGIRSGPPRQRKIYPRDGQQNKQSTYFYGIDVQADFKLY